MGTQLVREVSCQQQHLGQKPEGQGQAGLGKAETSPDRRQVKEAQCTQKHQKRLARVVGMQKAKRVGTVSGRQTSWVTSETGLWAKVKRPESYSRCTSREAFEGRVLFYKAPPAAPWRMG